VIRIGGTYYHLDATFDNTLSKDETIRYDYYNLSDTQIFKDHEPLVWKVPACTDGDHFYYKEKKLVFTKYEDVRKRALQAVKKEKTLLFCWRGGYLTREVLGELIQIFEEEAAKKEKHVRLSLNWPQAVLCVSFQKQLPETQVVQEEQELAEIM